MLEEGRFCIGDDYVMASILPLVANGGPCPARMEPATHLPTGGKGNAAWSHGSIGFQEYTCKVYRPSYRFA
jgi:hypothetical protein